MSLAPGARIGSFEVVSPLGAGGMGEVYRARDSKLKREVAIKVLPADVATDKERLARFQREAEVLASLNHPQIAHVYGFEADSPAEAGRPSSSLLVMELVEGEDLSQRIARGPIPIDEALPIAKQIAEALEAAHEAGIVHRDLKPGNIKVKDDGAVKVLDFGLARQASGIGHQASGEVANSPTITSPAMTMRGVILGTAAYMAPEQAKGKPVDKRADIWAFGCVLFEMLTGQRAFQGEDATDTIAEVLKSNVDWAALPGDTPASIRVLLRRCLEKDPRKRAAHMSIARHAIEDAATPTGELVRAAEPGRRVPIAAIVALTAVVALAAGWALSRYLASAPAEATATGEIVRFPLLVPDEFERLVTRPASMALSPDGRRLAFLASFTARIGLFVRDLSALAPKAMPMSTDVLAWPIWSPDGRYVAVTAVPTGRLVEADLGLGGNIRKLDPSGGPASTIAEWGRYPIWGAAGVIVFSGQDGRVYRVSEDGGATTAITAVDSSNGETAHLPQSFFPDGRRFIYTALNRDLGKTATFVGSIDGGAPTPLSAGVLRASLAGDWLWSLNSGTLIAQRMDPSTLRFDGGPVAIAEGVANYAVSAGGTLVIVPREDARVRMAWLDNQGAAAQTVGDPGAYSAQIKPEFSRDGTRMLFMRSDAGLPDIWQVELERNIATRLVASPYNEEAAVYTPDGKDVVYASNRNGPVDLFRRPADGSGSDEVLLSSPVRKTPTSISPDGSVLLYTQTEAETGPDIWMLPLRGDRTPKPLVVTRSFEGNAEFSPDGRWIAYCASERGEADQVIVEPYPPTGVRTRISTSEGSSPRWSANGREIYYGTTSGQIMKVALTITGATLRAGTPQTVVKAPQLFSHNSFALDARSRILALDGGIEKREPATVILNWPALLKDRATAK